MNMIWIVVQLLDKNQVMSMDLVDIFFQIMKTSSTAIFDSFVTTLKINHDMRFQVLDLKNILLRIQNKSSYTMNNGTWEVGTTADDQDAIYRLYIYNGTAEK